jgi:putative ABC transporter subunit
MSDLFHDGVPFDFIDRVMDVVKSSVHTFQFLTKRVERMGEYFASRPIPKNLWVGVTVENNLAKKRIDILRNLNAPIRFLSCEPLLEDLGEIDLTSIH